MCTVYVSSTEGIESALRRFKDKCDREGVKIEYEKNLAFRSKKQRERDRQQVKMYRRRARKRQKHKSAVIAATTKRYQQKTGKAVVPTPIREF